MTTVTTREEAVEVLKALTAEHGHQAYFIKADIIYSDGFYCIDLKVDGAKWRGRDVKSPIPAQINRVPICVIMHG